MSAPSKHDYPAWTKYSWGTEQERRVYRGHLLYVRDNGWWDSSGEAPHIRPAASMDEAKKDAEAWAENES